MTTVCKHFCADHVVAVRYASVADTSEPCLSSVMCCSRASYLWRLMQFEDVGLLRHKHSSRDSLQVPLAVQSFQPGSRNQETFGIFLYFLCDCFKL